MPQVLSTTPTFDPFSLDEIMKVPLMIKQEQDKIVEDYNKEADKIQQLRNIAALHPEVQPMIDEYDDSINTLAEAVQDGDIGDMRGVLQRARQGYRDLSKIKDYADIWSERMNPLIKKAAENPGAFFVDNNYSLSTIMNDPAAMPRTIDLDAIRNRLVFKGGAYTKDLAGYKRSGAFDIAYQGMSEYDQNIFRRAMHPSVDENGNVETFDNIVANASSDQARNVMYAMKSTLDEVSQDYGFKYWSGEIPELYDMAIEDLLSGMTYSESRSRIPITPRSTPTSNSPSEKSGSKNTPQEAVTHYYNVSSNGSDGYNVSYNINVNSEDLENWHGMGVPREDWGTYPTSPYNPNARVIDITNFVKMSKTMLSRARYNGAVNQAPDKAFHFFIPTDHDFVKWDGRQWVLTAKDQEDVEDVAKDVIVKVGVYTGTSSSSAKPIATGGNSETTKEL